ncbi:DUF3500 domain-containing protein [Streptomyces bobili]|uniref:DUF3500 domain-containing protein n=1 Tax=Streptomyces bobili TaxID=67280 RepID=UPI00224DDD98|nr:DUF3500 domain-containing protein [Streptomyces bobili]MCX5522518.1 DUF3500 domain-containing protein [Streptomyces bobili]
MRRTMTALAICVSLGVTGCSAAESTSSSSTAALTTGRNVSSVKGPGGANTAQVVAAANAFLATLSDEQKDTALYDFGDEVKKSGWTNFPDGVIQRNGLMMGDLTDEQQAAAMKVMEAALSKKGYEELVEIREADDYLAAAEDAGGTASPRPTPTGIPSGGPTGGPGGGTGGGGVHFGSQYYYLSFFGQPSKNGQFMVQFGGHHAAYNITYAGKNVSISPTLTGVEPMRFDWEEKFYQPLEDKRSSTMAAVQSLTESQLAAAEIDGSFDDLLLGPGNDGPFPTEPEGVLVSSLSKKQRAKVTAMLAAWVDDLDEKAAARLLAKYVSEYDKTYIGWSGGTTINDVNTYVRLDGPSAWIEFSNQSADEEPGVHQHTIFRDETADYGWN